ncbi:MAG: GNAT family N-acetyltransferase [Dehalococcoidales bacterium]|nr:GNAT family N-acetyltransferase [Dehalococcoidales bacterium]
MVKQDIQLTDGFVTLRPYTEGDAASLTAAARESIPEISPWMEWCRPDYANEQSIQWVSSRLAAWEEGSSYDFAIRDAATGRYLGGCGLSKIQNDLGLANLGYWVRTSATKKGVATATARLLAGFGFDELDLNRIELVIDCENLASQRVAEKLGAAREGILRNRLTREYQPVDAIMFSLIPGDIG